MAPKKAYKLTISKILLVRSQHCTTDQLFYFCQSIIDSFQEKPPKKTTSIFLDMTSAFDRVWREKLREKLHNIGRQLSRMCGTSLKTINNIIHKDLELDTRRKGKVHKLTTFHMKNRATNARKLYEEHLAGSRSEYTATLDEAWMYVTYCNGIRKICYIKRGNQVPDNWVHQCSETFPKGFMVVGVMTGRGVLPLIKVPSKVKVNSEFYIECVLKPVIEQLKDLYPGEMDKVFLHHDKASSHTTNKTQQFLQEMKDTLGLNFIRNSDIPVKSPDASPLDFYGFGMLKQRLFNRRPKTEAGLWKAAQEEWSNVSLSKVKETYSLESRRQNKNNLDRHFGNEEPEDEISLTTCGLVDPPFSENEVKLTAFKFGKRKSSGPEGIDNTVVKALRNASTPVNL
ncbi:ANKEF1 [Cordylochernes scorpioides]|uniref:ANKEF1 n=1 Tax=Cordylochernes scorpioides TaxID=51811 RepID=A0ABY6KZ45_9ARAC|nr:ANKEF1 [Cordylochernes scorpioides]